MAQIQMTEALSAALIVRMQAEYGQQAVSNFALDILLDSANAQIVQLTEDLKLKEKIHASLSERVRLAEDQIEAMKRANDPKRAEVMGAADEVKQRRTEKKNGPNSHTQ